MSEWKGELASFFEKQEKEEVIEKQKLDDTESKVAEFFQSTVKPAFEQLKPELEKHGKIVSAGTERIRVSQQDGDLEIDYTIVCQVNPNGVVIYPKMRYRFDGEMMLAHGFLRSDSSDCKLESITTDEIINHFLSEYKSLKSRRR